MALLDEIAGLVAGPLVDAGMTRSAVLIKVTTGTRLPGAVTSGTNSTEQRFAAQGSVRNRLAMQSAGTLIQGVDRVVSLLGATIEGGARPEPGDRIEIDGESSVIVAGGVSSSGARASYVCQCKS